MARKRTPPKISGLLNIDKPAGMTSHDVVQRLRRRLGERQVGHTGTLDPAARGVMVVAVGKATRLARFIEATRKSYRARVSLGVATTTYDAEGEITATAPVGALSSAQIDAALADLTGTIQQTVPQYSAVKVKGERLYKKARRGEDVELPRRNVEITRLVALGFDGASLELDCEVSKGTYIRSLAVDIGERLGLPAHLSDLVRTSVGEFLLDEAVSLEAEDLEESLLTLPEAVRGMHKVVLSGAAADGIRFGRAPSPSDCPGLPDAGLQEGEPIAIFDDSGSVLAIAEAPPVGESRGKPEDEGALRFACVLVG